MANLYKKEKNWYLDYYDPNGKRRRLSLRRKGITSLVDAKCFLAAFDHPLRNETPRIMGEIDEIIEQHGGSPDALISEKNIQAKELSHRHAQR